MSKQSSLLIDSNETLVLQTQLAVVVGDRQAIAIQQIHYWCTINQRMKRKSHFFDDHWWVYNTWSDWQKDNFPFWSINTIRRIFADLDILGLIVTRPHKTLKRGLWVSVNYSQLESFSLEKGNAIKVRRLHDGKRIKDSILESLSPQRFQNGQATSDPETIYIETKRDSASEKIDAGSVRDSQNENPSVPAQREVARKRPKNPAEDWHHALARSFKLDPEQLMKSKTADAGYWKVANELKALNILPEQIPALHEYIKHRAQSEGWKSYSVMVLAKYAPDFLQFKERKTTEFAKVKLIDPYQQP